MGQKDHTNQLTQSAKILLDNGVPPETIQKETNIPMPIIKAYLKHKATNNRLLHSVLKPDTVEVSRGAKEDTKELGSKSKERQGMAEKVLKEPKAKKEDGGGVDECKRRVLSNKKEMEEEKVVAMESSPDDMSSKDDKVKKTSDINVNAPPVNPNPVVEIKSNPDGKTNPGESRPDDEVSNAVKEVKAPVSSVSVSESKPGNKQDVTKESSVSSSVKGVEKKEVKGGGKKEEEQEGKSNGPHVPQSLEMEKKDTTKPERVTGDIINMPGVGMTDEEDKRTSALAEDIFSKMKKTYKEKDLQKIASDIANRYNLTFQELSSIAIGKAMIKLILKLEGEDISAPKLAVLVGIMHDKRRDLIAQEGTGDTSRVVPFGQETVEIYEKYIKTTRRSG